MKPKPIRPVLLFWGLAFLFVDCGNYADNTAGQNEFRNRTFKSNGEQIFFTATSQRGNPISFEMMGMMHMPGGNMACVNCHGPDGKGRTVPMMMGTIKAPDIRYSTLTSPEHGHAKGEEESLGQEMEHPPYTVETIKRAITQGVDPGGNPLNEFMPRWKISDEDLDDLIGFLKTLK